MRTNGTHSILVGMVLAMLTTGAVNTIVAAGELRPARGLDRATSAADTVMIRDRTTNGNKLVFHYILPGARAVTVKPSDAAEDEKSRVLLGNAIAMPAEGMPILPVVPVQIIVPSGKSIESINVKTGRAIRLPGVHAIEHGPAPVPTMRGAKVRKAKPNPDIYESNKLFPADAYTFVGLHRKRGVSIAYVNLHPVQYRPKSGTVHCYESMTLTLVMTDAQRKAGANRVRCRPKTLRPRTLDVENPHALESYTEEPPAATPLLQGGGAAAPLASDICDPNDAYQYVLITSQAIIDATTDVTVHDLTAHRQAQGLSATVVAVEDIYANYTGVDQAEQVREFIIDAYNTWGAEYVLLGGDVNVVPMRKLWCGSGTPDHIPSDLYFQCLDGNFNCDGDARWGEPTDGIDGGDVDLLAEVLIGRAPANNADEMSHFVYKTLAFENDCAAAPGTKPYLDRALVIGGSIGYPACPDGKVEMEQIRFGTTSHGYTTKGLSSPPAYQTDGRYFREGTWEAGAAPSAINSDAYSILMHHAHGSTQVLLGSWPSDWSESVLHNANFPFAYSYACHSGNFEQDCAAERAITSNRVGLFAAVLNSREGWLSTNPHLYEAPSHKFGRKFWDAYFDENIRTLGGMNADSHEEWIRAILFNVQRWLMYTLNLLGDPATRLSGNAPTLRFAQEYVRVEEDDGALAISLNLDCGPWPEDISVQVAVAGGTANPGADFTISGTTIDIPAGQTSGSLTLQILDDTSHEGHETVALELASPVNARLGMPATYIVVILDNDGPTIEFTSPKTSVLEDIGTVSISVQLTETCTNEVRGAYTVSGTAEGGGVDHDLADGVFVLAPGDTTASIPVTIVDDHTPEVIENIVVALDSVQNAAAGWWMDHIVEISDDDVYLSITKDTTPDRVIVEWNTYAGATYDLETLIDPLNDSWVVLADAITVEQDGSYSFTADASPDQRRMYRVMLNDSIASMNAVGYIKGAAVPGGYSMCGIPVVPCDGADGIQSIFGNLLTGGIDPSVSDLILKWDPIGQEYRTFWKVDLPSEPLYHGKWVLDDGAYPPNIATETFKPTDGFWVHSRQPTAQTMLFVGEIPLQDPSPQTIHEGFNMIAWPLFSPAIFQGTDLASHAIGGSSIGNADNLLKWNAAEQVYEAYWLAPPPWNFWIHGAQPAGDIQLSVGDGMWFLRRSGHGSFTWQESCPYRPAAQ